MTAIQTTAATAPVKRKMSRAEFEEKFFGVLKWASIVFFLIITAFPLFYMLALSFKPLSALLRDPAAGVLLHEGDGAHIV